jgi:arylformamidase
MTISDWDDAYANAPHIPGGADYPGRWAEKAAAFRALVPPKVLPYGPHPRERLDLFRPEGEARGLVVFVHGGFWMAFDRDHWSHLAAGALARGWAVVLPGYVLTPEARVAAITAAIGRAIEVAARAVAGPIRLAGHSAGGHLVTRQLCTDATLAASTAERIEGTLSISGLHDLRPLLRTALNDSLNLTLEEARAESPALREPREGVRLTAWVGAAERPEFLRQSALIANVWTGLGAAITATVEPDRHHFDVIRGLAEASSPITEALCGK